MKRQLVISLLILSSLSLSACIGEKEEEYIPVEGTRSIEMSLSGLDEYIEIAMSGDTNFQYENDLGDDFFLITEEDGSAINIAPADVSYPIYLIVESYLLGDGDDETEKYVFFLATEQGSEDADVENTLYGPFNDKIVYHLNQAGLGYTIQ